MPRLAGHDTSIKALKDSRSFLTSLFGFERHGTTLAREVSDLQTRNWEEASAEAWSLGAHVSITIVFCVLSVHIEQWDNVPELEQHFGRLGL